MAKVLLWFFAVFGALASNLGVLAEVISGKLAIFTYDNSSVPAELHVYTAPATYTMVLVNGGPVPAPLPQALQTGTDVEVTGMLGNGTINIANVTTDIVIKTQDDVGTTQGIVLKRPSKLKPLVLLVSFDGQYDATQKQQYRNDVAEALKQAGAVMRECSYGNCILSDFNIVGPVEIGPKPTTACATEQAHQAWRDIAREAAKNQGFDPNAAGYVLNLFPEASDACDRTPAGYEYYVNCFGLLSPVACQADIRQPLGKDAAALLRALLKFLGSYTPKFPTSGDPLDNSDVVGSGTLACPGIGSALEVGWVQPAITVLAATTPAPYTLPRTTEFAVIPMTRGGPITNPATKGTVGAKLNFFANDGRDHRDAFYLSYLRAEGASALLNPSFDKRVAVYGCYGGPCLSHWLPYTMMTSLAEGEEKKLVYAYANVSVRYVRQENGYAVVQSCHYGATIVGCWQNPDVLPVPPYTQNLGAVVPWQPTAPAAVTVSIFTFQEQNFGNPYFLAFYAQSDGLTKECFTPQDRFQIISASVLSVMVTLRCTSDANCNRVAKNAGLRVYSDYLNDSANSTLIRWPKHDRTGFCNEVFCSAFRPTLPSDVTGVTGVVPKLRQKLTFCLGGMPPTLPGSQVNLRSAPKRAKQLSSELRQRLKSYGFTELNPSAVTQPANTAVFQPAGDANATEMVLAGP